MTGHARYLPATVKVREILPLETNVLSIYLANSVDVTDCCVLKNTTAYAGNKQHAVLLRPNRISCAKQSLLIFQLLTIAVCYLPMGN